MTTRAIWPILGAIFAAGMVSAESMGECQDTRAEQRREAKAAYERNSCRDDRCRREAKTQWEIAQQQIDDAAAACRARARTQTKAEPPPYLNWKPGDPSPRANDGRLYLMSCGGKVLGLYKPGSAREVELKTYPGNCIPVEDWGPVGPSKPSQTDEGQPCTINDGPGVYSRGWVRGGMCQRAN